MSDAYSKAPRFSGRVVWTPESGWTDNAGHGYICKRCAGPSPVGIGYVDGTAGAGELSATLTVCGCGWSVAPAPPVRETVWCEAHDGLSNPHFERDDCVHPHFTDAATRARINAEETS